jgi:hypothetical protein
MHNLSTPPQRNSLPELTDSEPGRFRCSCWQNVTFLLWSDQATLNAVQRIQRITKAMIQRYPGGHSNVSFVLKGVRPPADDARVAMLRSFDARISTLKCLSTITEGDGFWASTLRSSVINMGMSSGSQLQMRMHASIDEAVRWLPEVHAEQTGVELDPRELAEALRAFRAQVP